MFDQKTLNAHQARWIAFLSEYDFEIRHVKGKENIVENALRQQQNEMHSVLVSEYESEFKNLLKTMSNSDDQYKKMTEICKHRTVGTEGRM